MQNQPTCLYCGATDKEMPLVNLTYQGQPLWICSAHLPILIHEQEKLAAQLAAAVMKSKENYQP